MGPHHSDLATCLQLMRICGLYTPPVIRSNHLGIIWKYIGYDLEQAWDVFVQDVQGKRTSHTNGEVAKL